MNYYDFESADQIDETPRERAPHRKSSGPGRDRKQKARRSAQRKQASGNVGGIHRRGSKRPSSR